MVINNKTSSRKPSVNRFYRHLTGLISKGCTDVRFELRMDGDESEAFHIINGKAYEYTGEILDAYKAIEEMVPIPESGGLSTGNYIKKLDELKWDNAANISCRYHCASKNQHYEVCIRIRFKLLN